MTHKPFSSVFTVNDTRIQGVYTALILMSMSPHQTNLTIIQPLEIRPQSFDLVHYVSW